MVMNAALLFLSATFLVQCASASACTDENLRQWNAFSTSDVVKQCDEEIKTSKNCADLPKCVEWAKQMKNLPSCDDSEIQGFISSGEKCLEQVATSAAQQPSSTSPTPSKATDNPVPSPSPSPSTSPTPAPTSDASNLVVGLATTIAAFLFLNSSA